MPKILVLKRDSRGRAIEYIIKRKARKLYVCHDSGKAIPKGAVYIEDHISYLQRRKDDSVWKKWVTNKICMSAWRGPLPS